MALSRPAIGNIATSDWRYLSQRLTFSTIESNITCFSIDVHDLSSWTWCVTKSQPKNMLSVQFSPPLHPNQPLVWMYIFLPPFFSLFILTKTSSCHSPHQTSMLICHFKIFQTTTRMTKNDLKRLKTTEYSHNYDLTRICLELFLEQKYQCYCRISEL